MRNNILTGFLILAVVAALGSIAFAGGPLIVDAKTRRAYHYDERAASKCNGTEGGDDCKNQKSREDVIAHDASSQPRSTFLEPLVEPEIRTHLR